MTRNAPVDIPLAATEPDRDCPLCPRLVALREELRAEHPDWWNAPVPAWGDPAAWLAIIGLAPGKHGANRTGRPFTGDYAGDLLFETLSKMGLARGSYGSAADDGFELDGAIIINAVKCLPPQNKPTSAEINQCRQFLSRQEEELPKARIFIALGRIAHDSFVRHCGGRLADFPFGHNRSHTLPDGRILIDSYHCSRYNTNTGRLTPEMFEAVFEQAKDLRRT
ncbi:uracil-DNA glycosylase [Novosphingopyxis sp. YJ-S2-01]|uniref:uracil-DNA glycosylase n=1 Tax=Novosphingopyxis sp. YJ-S2-01 TaxID=2794021 RepID=UPI0018DCD4A3|nr:uracil-DNA glycosylase [Novosphingopyxis sp. YJ-S2-01]MBH9537760.1 uracil-DNA glycosylase [Novosphingopyxis sp. YJ-S2-01]